MKNEKKLLFISTLTQHRLSKDICEICAAKTALPPPPNTKKKHESHGATEICKFITKNYAIFEWYHAFFGIYTWQFKIFYPSVLKQLRW